MNRTIYPERPLDGRRQRGRDNRARIVKAMMEIVHSGQVTPSAEQVAARADVGLRTVFRHFQDMDSLYREIAQVVGVEVREILSRPLQTKGVTERVVELVGQRALAFEEIAPYKRAADIFRHRSKFLGSDYGHLVVELRAILLRELPERVTQDPLRLESLDLLLSFEAWSRLRREQNLSVEAAQDVLEAAVRRLIA